MCTYRTVFPVPAYREPGDARIPRGKVAFAKPLAHGSVWQITPEDGPERIVWVIEARAGARSIAFREVVFGEDPENAWIESEHIMSFMSFTAEFAEHQVEYLGVMSPTAWPEFVSVIQAFDKNRRWTIDFVLRSLAFLRSIDAIAGRGSHSNVESLAMGCQPAAEPKGGRSA